MPVIAILALIALILAVVACFPQTNSYPLNSVAVILLAIAVFIMGRGGH